MSKITRDFRGIFGRRGPKWVVLHLTCQHPFETSVMRRTFDTAVEAAQAGDVWREPVALPEPWADFLKLFKL